MRKLLQCVAAALLGVIPAFGAPPDDAATHWRALARLDVEAAYRLLKENHPAAVAETGDRAFVAQLEAAHRRALTRAAQVRDVDGLYATLGEFANAMGDGHIRSKARYRDDTVRWAGIIAAKRSTNWMVAATDGKIAGSDLVGARIVSCDGKPAGELARERLRFTADVDAEFMLVNLGGHLLLDEGNPFAPPPKACIFDKAGAKTDLTLRWTEIDRKILEAQYLKPPYGQAGFGLRKAGAGYWIAIQSLSGAAQPVIDAVKAARTAVRAAPFVVIDLRGNGGGNSDYADLLITELWGEDYINAAFAAPAGGATCGVVYRASQGNIDGFAEQIEKRFKPQGDKGGEKLYTAAIAEMRKALAEGKPLTGKPHCTPPKLVPPAMKPAIQGHVYVLTDTRCFSSCLIAVDNLRQLGATQLGEPTAYNTNYLENREIVLPSGLATFATQQAITNSAPPRFGPFVPEKAFAGDIADTEVVERWVLQTVSAK